MRKSLVTGATIAAMLFGGLAHADVVVGKVKSIDLGAKSVTLENGSTYKLGSSAEHTGMIDGYLPGDAVKIVTVDDTMDAIAMSPDFSDAVTGKVKSIDTAAHTVTLANGIVYKFTNSRDDKLDGYKVGDNVKIMAHQVGMSHWGETISPVS